MSMKKKIVLKGFDYMHCDDFARYLENMAANGWHFKEWGAGLKFEKGKPEQVTYAVEVFTKASENDMRPTPQMEEFAEYCERAGWKLIDAKQKFCIFKKVKEDTIELFTPQERVENAFKGAVSRTAIILLVLYGINVLLQWINITNFFEDYIFASSFLYSFAIWHMLFLGQMGVFIYAFIKRHKLLCEIKTGEDIHIGICKDNKFHIHMRDVYIGFLIVLMLAYLGMSGKMEEVWITLFVIVVTVVFCAILAKVRPSYNTNVIIQLVFSIALTMVILIASFTMIVDNREIAEKQKDVPLYLSDYREELETITDISIHERANLLGRSAYYFIFGREESIHYDIYETKYDWILDRIWEKVLEKKVNAERTECSDEWEAKMAFRNTVGNYYVRYENQIFVLYEDDAITLTAEQISVIRKKMDLR